MYQGMLSVGHGSVPSVVRYDAEYRVFYVTQYQEYASEYKPVYVLKINQDTWESETIWIDISVVT